MRAAPGRGDEAERALYVHLRSDGGIFVVRGDTGEQAWITRRELEQELDRMREAGGLILYSRDDPDRDPADIVFDTFSAIEASRLPIKLVDEPHPDTTLGGGATTLMASAFTGAADAVEDLLDRGADLEARDESGYTALMYAANAGELPSAERLLERGADVDARDAQGSTPLMFAAQHGHDDIVRRLLDDGADVHVRGDHGRTALDFAHDHGHGTTARLLEEGGAERSSP